MGWTGLVDSVNGNAILHFHSSELDHLYSLGTSFPNKNIISSEKGFVFLFKEVESTFV